MEKNLEDAASLDLFNRILNVSGEIDSLVEDLKRWINTIRVDRCFQFPGEDVKRELSEDIANELANLSIHSVLLQTNSQLSLL